MGWGLRLFAAFVGLASFGAGLWPVGVICFAYLATSLRPRKSRDLKEKIGGTHRAGLRHVLAAALLLLSAVALASGGALSPVVFFAGGMTVLLWPKVIRNSPSLELVPVANSVLLRPRFFPLTWVALAEFKAGSEAFPRALSHFTGTLLLFVETGKAYALASCRSLAKREAEINVLSQFKLSAPPGGAYLLPLDSGSAAGVLRVKMAPVRLPPGDLAESAQ